MKKKSFAMFQLVVLMGGALVLGACNDETDKTKNNNEKQVGQNNTTNDSVNDSTSSSEEKRDEGGYIIGKKIPDKEHYVDGVLLANKEYPMPENFAPGESKEAREAFNELNRAAVQAGFQFDAFSTYRSFDRQKVLYDNYVKRDGKEKADRYSARPGFSEHQTGLAFDVGEVGHSADYADDRFGKTPAGQWIAENAHLYGFILRYPEGKEHITGYQFESWHFRYVGKEIAKKIFDEGITLEEFLHDKG